MKTRFAFVTATALSVLMAGVAFGNSNNTLYIEQDGEGNSASITQSFGGGNNDIGTLADPVTQQGDLNSFTFSNSSYGSGTNNDIAKAEQIGDGNFFSNSAWNGANNNKIVRSEQLGDGNRASVSFNGSDEGGVDTLLQQGDNNHLVISQQGAAGNKVLSVSMIGSNNGLSPDANGAPRRAGVYILQSQSGNRVQSASLEGSNNIGPSGDSNTHRSTIRIEQVGVDNGQLASVASTLGSAVGGEYNRLWIFQNGNNNNFSVQQGLSTASTGNHAIITQTGNGNMSSGTQAGDRNTITATSLGNSNSVAVTQTGDDNYANVNIDGNYNGGGNFTGLALAAAGTLGSGQIVQTGLSNDVFYDVEDSDSNQFAFSQVGNGNLVDGTVSGAGGNQAVVNQTGDTNKAVFAQIGGANALVVLQ